jgi:hypothetical protein
VSVCMSIYLGVDRPPSTAACIQAMVEVAEVIR